MLGEREQRRASVSTCSNFRRWPLYFFFRYKWLTTAALLALNFSNFQATLICIKLYANFRLAQNFCFITEGSFKNEGNRPKWFHFKNMSKIIFLLWF